MPIQHRVKRHFVTDTDDGPLITVYPTQHSVLPIPLKTAACRSLQEARTIVPSATSPNKKSAEGGGSESPTIRRRGAPTLVFAEVGNVPASFGTGALDDLELQRRERLGILKRKPCAFCGSVFGTEHLQHRVSRKAIVEQLAAWGRTNLRPRDLTAANLYEAVSVCVFCAQFFDDDALLRRCDPPPPSSSKSGHGAKQKSANFTTPSRRSSTASVVSSHGKGGGGGFLNSTTNSTNSTNNLSLFGPVEDQIERRLHKESVEARRILASVLRDDSDEAAAAYRHEMAREEAHATMRQRIRDERRAEVAKLKQKLRDTIASQQRAAANNDHDVDSPTNSSGVHQHTNPSGSGGMMPSVHVMSGSPRSGCGGSVNESDSFSASTSASHYLFPFGEHSISEAPASARRVHGGDPLEVISNDEEHPHQQQPHKQPQQVAPVLTNRCTELRSLACKRKRELQRMRLELRACEDLGLPVDAQFRMQYEQLSLWCSDKTRHEFEQSALAEEQDQQQAANHHHQNKSSTMLWFQSGAVKPGGGGGGGSRPVSAASKRPTSAASSRAVVVERPRSALAAHRAQHQAALDRHDARQGMHQGRGVDPLYAKWLTARDVSARFSMYKV